MTYIATGLIFIECV